MTNHRTILRDSAFFIPPLLVAGWVLGGPMGAAGVLVTGVVSLLNLRVLAWVVARLASAMASESGEGSGVAILVMMLKTIGALLVYGTLMWLFDPLSVAIGLGSVVLGITMSGLRTAPTSDDDLVRES